MNELDGQKQAVKWLRILYPVWAIIGMFSLMYVPSQLIDTRDPALTAANILENELLFRTSISGSLITQLFSIGAVWLLFKLFYQSYKEATILMAIFTFIGMPIAMHSTAGQLLALEMTADPEQLVVFLKLHSRGTSIATIFWGLWLLPLGYIIIQSPLFPSIIGWLVILAGGGYMLSAFAYFMGLEGLFIEVLEYLTLGEVLWMLWVMIMGAKWKAIET